MKDYQNCEFKIEAGNIPFLVAQMECTLLVL